MAGNGANKYTSQEAGNIKLGQTGYNIVTNTTVNSDTYVAITATMGTEIEADSDHLHCTVSATSVDTDIWDSLSSFELPVGATIYGRWSSVQVHSANDIAIVYKG